jgi:tetratricopeptide (TPR) repeat protein
VGKIELRQSFGGLSGTVQIEPTLSWRDSLAVQATAEATRDVAGAVYGAAAAIRALEYDIGLRLDAQTEKLERQVGLLTQIAESLRTPARVRAAERVAATGELLRRGRYARARDTAALAAEDDPNNADAFTALAWSQMGLGELELARDSFAEAVAAADGDDKSRARRARARLTFAIDGAATALELLEAHLSDCSPTEQAAVSYDRAIYLCEIGDTTLAKKELFGAVDVDVRHLLAATEDPQATDVFRALATSELQQEVVP